MSQCSQQLAGIDLVVQPGHHWCAHTKPVYQCLTGLTLFPELEGHDEPYSGDQVNPPISLQRMAHGHKESGSNGQDAFFAGEKCGEFGENSDQNKNNHQEPDKAQDSRVSQGGPQLGNEGLTFFLHFRQPIQNLLQEPAGLSGFDHTDEDIIEYLRVAPHSV